MPRIARAVAPGLPHHVTQRGNYRQPVFENEDDFLRYYFWLKKYSRQNDLSIWAYCFMPNHVHYVCVPQGQKSLSRTFNILHMRYSQYFHRKKNIKGHLWQGRFYSSILDERHLFAAIRYVENNPVRAGIVRNPKNYRWSSVHGHLFKHSDTVLAEDCHLEREIQDWSVYLKGKEDTRLFENIRKNSLTGRPCGDDIFIQAIEKLLERKLKAREWGRPRRKS